MTKTIYYKHHIKTEPTYQIIEAGEMQIDDEWFEAVIYRDIESKKVYCMKETQFNKEFKNE